MKKIKHLLTILIVICTMFTSVMAETSYSDVNSTDWFYTNLLTLTDKEIIDGFTDGTFKPDGTLMLDQYIKLLVATQNSEITINQTYWAYDYIEYAFNTGILDDTYTREITDSNYNQTITRYDTVYILANMLEDSDIPDDYSIEFLPFEDFDSIPEKYLDPLAKCYTLGIIAGYPDGEFKGNNTLTRAEATAIISRYLFPQQRNTPVTFENLFERIDLIESYDTEELQEKTNLYVSIDIDSTEITYTSPFDTLSLSELNFPTGQENFVNNVFIDWNNAVINGDDDEAYLSTSMFENSFRMRYTCSEATDTALSFNSTLDGDTILYLAYDLSLDESSSVYTLLSLLTDNYATGSSEELLSAIVSGYNTANETPGYENTQLVNSYSVTSSTGEDYVFILLSYPE